MSQNLEVIRHYKGGMFNPGNEPIPDEHATVERSLDAQVMLHDGIDSLSRLVSQLSAAVETLDEPNVPSIEDGLDFYAEVRKFEMSLIQRALKHTLVPEQSREHTQAEALDAEFQDQNLSAGIARTNHESGKGNLVLSRPAADPWLS